MMHRNHMQYTCTLLPLAVGGRFRRGSVYQSDIHPGPSRDHEPSLQVASQHAGSHGAIRAVCLSEGSGECLHGVERSDDSEREVSAAVAGQGDGR